LLPATPWSHALIWGGLKYAVWRPPAFAASCHRARQPADRGAYPKTRRNSAKEPWIQEKEAGIRSGGALSQGPEDLSIPRQLPAFPMMVFPIRTKHPLDMAVQGSHDTDARKHRWSIQLRDQHQALDRGLPFGGVRFFLRERHDVGRGVPQVHKRLSYSGVPRRGGASAGRPPIQCGMSAICSPAVRPPAQSGSHKHARPRRADLMVVVAVFILELAACSPLPCA